MPWCSVTSFVCDIGCRCAIHFLEQVLESEILPEDKFVDMFVAAEHAGLAGVLSPHKGTCCVCH